MKHYLRKIALGLVVTLVSTDIVLAADEEYQADIYWFTSSTSSLLNRSSIELASSHYYRGIRSAHQALDKGLSLMDQVIANHNLCIAYLVSDREALATQYCDRAYELAQRAYRIVKVRGAYRLQESDVIQEQQKTLSPMQVITNNIERQRLRTGVRVTQLTE